MAREGLFMAAEIDSLISERTEAQRSLQFVAAELENVWIHGLGEPDAREIKGLETIMVNVFIAIETLMVAM